MNLQIIQGDIIQCQTDAIVNAANQTLLGGGGVDGAIHRAAGPELLRECATLGGCKTGQAKITKAGRLPAKYVIHTVGPVWRDGNHNEPELLRNCYKNSLQLATDNHCHSIAFPAISTGVYRYPLMAATQIALDTIHDYLSTHPDLKVTCVCFDHTTFETYNSLITMKLKTSIP